MSYQLIHGSAHDIPLPDKSVHSLVCSPPYFGLRAYSGEQAIEWPTVEYAPMAGMPIYRPDAHQIWTKILDSLPASMSDEDVDRVRETVYCDLMVDIAQPMKIRIQGCEPGCGHEWADGPRLNGRGGQSDFSSSTLKSDGRPEESRVKTLMENAKGLKLESPSTAGSYCIHCSGWRGGLGLEPSIEMYIGHLILCLREWWRILRDDGTVFVNLGDSYNGSGGAGGDYGKGGLKEGQPKYPGRRINGLKAKDLCMIPARFALAAQADGWYLRSAIVWAKGVSFIPHYAGSCMPESVTDRCTQSYEMVYMLAKSEKYYYDHIAVQEQGKEHAGLAGTFARANGKNTQYDIPGQVNTSHRPDRDDRTPTTRNLRSVWAISPKGFSGAHFACWPEALVTPMIKASTSAHGVCKSCGSPYRRVVEREGSNWEDRKAAGAPMRYGMNNNKGEAITNYSGSQATTTGWQPTCQCNCDEVIPATVIDPFCGSGTSLRAAIKLGRNAIGVDISNEYLGDLVPERTSNVQMEMAL